MLFNCSFLLQMFRYDGITFMLIERSNFAIITFLFGFLFYCLNGDPNFGQEYASWRTAIAVYLM